MAVISHQIQKLFTAVMYLIVMTSAHLYELIYMTDSTTELSGSITMQCRDALSTEPLEINQTGFWLNRSSACDLDLRARADVGAIGVDAYSIKLNLTHNLDGIYTCGRLVTQGNEVIVKESNRITLVCKLNLIIRYNSYNISINEQ